MAWDTAHIFWREQLLILSILLPPIFCTSIMLALFSPRLFAHAKKEPERAAKNLTASPDPVPTVS